MDTTDHKNQAILNALTVDVEDYYHVEAFANKITRDDWDRFPARVVGNTHRVLELFARNSCQATFFVLGWVAERFPRLIRDIADAGHEIACHSYAHQRVSTLTPDEFRADVRRAKKVIGDACGRVCLGYRAPSFSIVRSSLWALDILGEEGFTYDSSVFPIRHDIYGFPDAPRRLHVCKLAEGRSITEIPMSTVSLAGRNLPFSGGGYMRILPFRYTQWAMARSIYKDKTPVVVYFHPWEVDPNQPRVDASIKSKFRHYTGLSRMENRLERLLQLYKFTTMQVLAGIVSEHREESGTESTQPRSAGTH